jgi:hypothetical protein
VGQQIVINPAAFKHGATEADIYRVIETKIYEGQLLAYENKYAIVGFDTAGNAMEIMYNIIDNGSINVFHAMKARKGIINQLARLDGGKNGVHDR